MSKVIDLTGQRFGRLVVLERAENNNYGQAQWLCLCDCGNKKIINGGSLRKGATKSCGCIAKEKLKKYNDANKLKNEIGNIYGYLTVISRNEDPQYAKDGRAMWNCQCKCGNIYVTSGKLLREGKVTSCGYRRQSIGEEKIEKLLTENNIPFELEYSVTVRKEKIFQRHPARFDFFVNNQYFIEYDGKQHFQYCNSGWNSKENFEKTKERDNLKNQYCKDNNIPLIRIPYTHYNDLCIEDLLLETTKFKVV